MYTQLSEEEHHSLGMAYDDLSKNRLIPLLKQGVWKKYLYEFNSQFFSELRTTLSLENEVEKMAFNYFVKVSQSIIAFEMQLWLDAGNSEPGPPVAIGRVLIERALVFEESLDYILGTNSLAHVEHIQIIPCYDHTSAENTHSDHHMLVADISLNEVNA